MKTYKDLVDLQLTKIAKTPVPPSPADKASLTDTALASKYTAHYTGQKGGSTPAGRKTLARNDIISQGKATSVYNAYTSDLGSKLTSALGYKGPVSKTTGVAERTNKYTKEGRDRLDTYYKTKMPTNLYTSILADWGGKTFNYIEPATVSEKKTLSSKRLAKRFPDYYGNKSQAFQAMLTQQDDWDEYNTYLGNVAAKYGPSARSIGLLDRKNPATFNARSVLHEQFKPIMESNVYKDLLEDWGGEDWKFLSGGGSAQEQGLIGGRNYSMANLANMQAGAFAKEIEKLMKENPELAKKLVEQRTAAKGLYGKYAPGGMSPAELVEASKIKAERESMKEPDKQQAHRYADPSTGEVPQVYDSPADQAKFEKRVGEFRAAMKALLPYAQVAPPKQRDISDQIKE